MIFFVLYFMCLSDMMQITKNRAVYQTKVGFWAAEERLCYCVWVRYK
jgi:hypothetical protein